MPLGTRMTESSQVSDPGEPARQMPTERQIDAAVRALALAGEPSRLRILWALSSDEMDVTSLATLARITATAASQHLAKLRLAGLVTARRQGRRVLYSAHRSHVRRLIAEALFHGDHEVSGEPAHD